MISSGPFKTLRNKDKRESLCVVINLLQLIHNYWAEHLIFGN